MIALFTAKAVEEKGLYRNPRHRGRAHTPTDLEAGGGLPSAVRPLMYEKMKNHADALDSASLFSLGGLRTGII